MEVAASANELDAATQFADGHRRDKSESAGLDDLFEEAITPLFAPSPLRASLMTFVSIKYIAGLFIALDPLEIGVEADRRH